MLPISIIDDIAPPERVSAKLPDAAVYLSQKQLARRWRMSHRTLERWRQLSRGPVWLKIGGRVLYRVEDVVVFEMALIAGGPCNHDDRLCEPAQDYEDLRSATQNSAPVRSTTQNL